MPRAPRIEFEDAVYHVMARGNRREPIVFNDSDRKLFTESFAEACEMTGWEVFAWVLMDNHYHAVFRTPHANLVEGMKWFQNAYTRRLNSRHRLWGHLFGGRYRSILVENRDYGGAVWRDYLRSVIDYVHLNPGRARLVDGVEKSAGEYPWSSLVSYLLPASQRPAWLVVPEALDLFGLNDTVKGRREFVHRIDDWIRHEKGDPAVSGTSVATRAKEGWFWGTESFKEAMLSFLDDRVKLKTRSGRNRTYQSSKLVKDHGERSAIAILESAAAHFRMTREQLKSPVRGDHTRAAVAYRLYKETTVSQDWIAEALGMRSAPNVCQQIRKFRLIEDSKRHPKIRKWIKVQII